MEVNFSRLLEGGQKRMMLYIAGGIAGILMMLVILCNLLLIVSNAKEPDQMPEVFGIRPAIVLSGSMEPTFYPGDVILLKKDKGTGGAGGGGCGLLLIFGQGDDPPDHREI